MFLLIYNRLKAKEKKSEEQYKKRARKIYVPLYMSTRKKTYIYLLSFTVMKVLKLLHADNGCQICG